MTDATIHTLNRPYTPHVVETVKPALGTISEIYGAMESAVHGLAWALSAADEGSQVGLEAAEDTLDAISAYMAALRVKLARMRAGGDAA